MANYRNPIDLPNPFFTTPLVVLVVRHVRIVAATGEVVIEDANTLPRHLARTDAQHVYPRRLPQPPPERNVPESFTRKKQPPN